MKNLGGVFILQVRENVYKLDGKGLGEKYAGKKVHLTGVLDPKTNIIALRAIDPLP